MKMKILILSFLAIGSNVFGFSMFKLNFSNKSETVFFQVVNSNVEDNTNWQFNKNIRNAKGGIVKMYVKKDEHIISELKIISKSKGGFNIKLPMRTFITLKKVGVKSVKALNETIFVEFNKGGILVLQNGYE